MPEFEPLTQDQIDFLQEMHDYDLAVAHAHWDECPNSRAFYLQQHDASCRLSAAQSTTTPTPHG